MISRRIFLKDFKVKLIPFSKALLNTKEKLIESLSSEIVSMFDSEIRRGQVNKDEEAYYLVAECLENADLLEEKIDILLLIIGKLKYGSSQARAFTYLLEKVKAKHFIEDHFDSFISLFDKIKSYGDIGDNANDLIRKGFISASSKVFPRYNRKIKHYVAPIFYHLLNRVEEKELILSNFERLLNLVSNYEWDEGLIDMFSFLLKKIEDNDVLINNLKLLIDFINQVEYEESHEVLFSILFVGIRNKESLKDNYEVITSILDDSSLDLEYNLTELISIFGEIIKLIYRTDTNDMFEAFIDKKVHFFLEKIRLSDDVYGFNALFNITKEWNLLDRYQAIYDEAIKNILNLLDRIDKKRIFYFKSLLGAIQGTIFYKNNQEEINAKLGKMLQYLENLENLHFKNEYSYHLEFYYRFLDVFNSIKEFKDLVDSNIQALRKLTIKVEISNKRLIQGNLADLRETRQAVDREDEEYYNAISGITEGIKFEEGPWDATEYINERRELIEKLKHEMKEIQAVLLGE